MATVPESKIAQLMQMLCVKLEQSGKNFGRTAKKMVEKYDDDKSGSLEYPEFMNAVQGFLNWPHAHEVEAFAGRFDQDGSGDISIGEFVEIMTQYQRGEITVPPPPPQPEARPPPPPPGGNPSYFDALDATGPGTAAPRSRGAARPRVGRATDAAASVSDTRPFPQASERDAVSLRDPQFERRLQKFLARLRGRLAEVANARRTTAPALARPGSNRAARLPQRRAELLDRLAREALMGQFRAAQEVTNPAIKLRHREFVEALAHFRTPGQPSLPAADLDALWHLCEKGDPAKFVELVFDKPAPTGPGASHARENKVLAQARRVLKSGGSSTTAVSLNYRYARTAVQPPIGWGRTELQGAVVESMKVPKEALALEHIYGYRTDMPGTNLSAAGGGKFLVWSVASVAVVLDLAEGSQKHFMGHENDITAMCVDSSGDFAATGQVKSPDQDPFVYVWEVATCEPICKLGEGRIDRQVCALQFTGDGSHLIVVGADDRHTLSVWDLSQERPEPVGTPMPAQNGLPPMVFKVVSATSEMASSIYGVTDVFVSVGNQHLCFWAFDHEEAGQYELTPKKATFESGAGKPPAPTKHYDAAFVPGEDVIVTAADNGHVYMWRDYLCIGLITPLSRPAHMGAVRSLCHTAEGLFTAGDDGKMLSFTRNKGKYALSEPNDGTYLADSGASAGGGPSGKGKRSSNAVLGPKTSGAKVVVTQPSIIDIAKYPLKQVDGNPGNWMVAGVSNGVIQFINLDNDDRQVVIDCHDGELFALAPHPNLENYFITAGYDSQVTVWDAVKRVAVDEVVLPKKLKAHCVAIMPNSAHIAVGCVDGTLIVYKTTKRLQQRGLHECARPQGATRIRKAINDLKYAPDSRALAAATREKTVVVFAVDADGGYRHRCTCKGHSSTVLHLDWSADSRLLQTNDSSYEILYWDATNGREFRSTNDTVESDTVWATWTCRLGFPVMGIYNRNADGTDVNAVHRSRNGRLVVTADDNARLNLLRAPVLAAHAPRRSYHGHSSHVTNVRFLAAPPGAAREQRVVTVGGHDAAIFQWKITTGDWPDEGPSTCAGEHIDKPPGIGSRNAWHKAHKLPGEPSRHTTVRNPTSSTF